jgi:peptide/nickel transport system permease protein
MNRIKSFWSDIKRYPSAVAGLGIIGLLILVSIYAMISIPYNDALALWRGGEALLRENPRNARPEWVNWFSDTDLPKTIVLNSQDGTAEKRVEDLGGATDVIITYTFDFTYDAFPQSIVLYINSQFDTRQPHVTMTWITPDGREIRGGELSASRSQSHRFAQDDRLLRRLRGVSPEIAFFADPDREEPVPLKGTYQLELNALMFDEGSDLDAQLVIHGQVYGMAGTDHRRRDLMVALLWGTPIALAFGLLAAVGTSVTTMIIAAIGVWFGGWVDGVIQRITEVNLILPVLPILIMVGIFYSRSIWVILGVLIALNIFSSGIKTLRAVFLQVKESPYIEAAQAYGAGNWRIIFRYLLPRILPLLVPQLVVLIPTFVFIEASLAVLGLGDPVLPTWGKVINDANSNGALHNGHYYWVLEPAALLMLTGLGFSMVGFALDRIFNPRLRGL